MTVSVALFVVPLAVAVMVTLVVAVTGLVVTVKVLLVVPAGIEMLDGTVATAVLLLVRVTVMLLGPAARSSVTVPVEFWPPVTVVGLSVSDAMPMRLTVRLTLLPMPFAVAVSVPTWLVPTAVVVMLKVLLVVPAATTTLAGKVVEARLSESVTVMLLGAARHSSVTVPVAVLPPTMGLGLTLTELTPMARTASVSVLLTPFSVAVTVPP